MNFYNENDPQKAAWLRELIKAGIISKGIVDERSIEELGADELDQYTQCHFFAGIGIWSYALRLANWPDSQRTWTGSCPCQPFSVAGERKGQMDQRHLWPAWFRLITQRRPVVVFGEQVADGDGITWLDSVQTDLEAAHYRVGPCVLPAAGFGAPHGRHRLVFVADTQENRFAWKQATRSGRARASHDSCLVYSKSIRQPKQSVAGNIPGENCPQSEYEHTDSRFECSGTTCDVAHPAGGIRNQGKPQPIFGPTEKPSAVNGFWSDAEWLWCKDQKYRAVEPGTFPLAHGASARILRLRGYGDGIVAPQAAEFIKAYREITEI